jgi:hypothetical protein
MEHTTAFERALHLLLFLAGGLALAVFGLAVIERLAGGDRRTIRIVHVAAAGALFAGFFVAERVYHAVH